MAAKPRDLENPFLAWLPYIHVLYNCTKAELSIFNNNDSGKKKTKNNNKHNENNRAFSLWAETPNKVPQKGKISGWGDARRIPQPK